MKVLFVAAWFPYPADNGSRIRTYQLIKALSNKHEVYLVSLLQDDSDPVNVKYLSDICNVVSLHPSRWFKPGSFKSMLGYLSSRPRSMVDIYDPAVRSSVGRVLNEIKPDVVIASTLGVVEYVSRPLDIPCILDEHNCEYAVLRRNAANIDGALKRLRYDAGWKKFARWESGVCRSFDSVVMVSDGDCELMLEAAPDLRNLEVVPNGVDTDHYDPANRHSEQSTLIYNGAVTFRANLDAVRYFTSDIYPLLIQSMRDIKLRITGRTTGIDLRGISDCPGIEFTGYVNDIRDVLASSALCVVPLRQGGGSRLKILEAMAAGVPVVSTSIGAEGIDGVDGRHLLLADTPQNFADCILRLLNDESMAAEMAADARKLVEERYSWLALGQSFVDIVESTCQAHISS
ncbi:glycosyltransferase family 4 protein [bacterium]|nr:glycosyltransferase family 4 protein [bacterium]